MSRLHWRTIIVNLILLTIGALISAVSVIVFMAPFQMAPGGVSGLMASAFSKLIAYRPVCCMMKTGYSDEP